MDAYAAYGAIARPGSLPGAHVVAVVSASMFIPWLVLLGLILLLTPSGRLSGRFTRIVAWTMLIGGAVGFAVGLVRPYSGDYADQGIIDNPLEVSTGAGVFTVLRWGGSSRSTSACSPAERRWSSGFAGRERRNGSNCAGSG
jgi:hypothetical protein